MNIFFTNVDPVKAAINLRFHTTLHNKMILESAQLLFNALRLKGFNVPYKPSHVKHECTLWLLQDGCNFVWLWDHFTALSEHYESVSGKVYKSYRIYSEWIKDNPQALDTFELGELTLPFLAFSKGNEDLEKVYGHYSVNPNDPKTPYAIANSLDSAVSGYRQYLLRKPYAQDKIINFM